MSKYYDELPTLIVYGNLNNPKVSKETKEFINAEYFLTGNFAHILQEKVKTIIPLEEIWRIEIKDNAPKPTLNP